MLRRTFIKGAMSSAVICAVLFLLCFTSETFTVACISTLVLIVCLYFKRSITITLADVLVVAVLLWEIVTTVSVAGVGNTGVLSKVYFFAIYYFILRLALTGRMVTGNFLFFISVIALAISLICIVSFGIFREKVLSSGFESLYDFKYLYRPFGELNNVWASVFLSLTGVVVLGFFFLRGKRELFLALPFTVLLYCLIISFSRGIYISVLLLLAVLAGFVAVSQMKIPKKILCAAGLLSICVFLSVPNGSDVMRTVKMTETVSQRRSMENRIDAVSYLLPAMKKSPIAGVGSGRYSMAVNEFVYENEASSITDFAPNIISKLLLEKGIVGALLWFLIYITIFVRIINVGPVKQNFRLRLFVFIFMTILLLREMTFAALLEDERMLAVLAVFLAMSQNASGEMKWCVAGGKKWGVLLCVLVPFLTLVVCRQMFIDNGKHFRAFSESMRNEEYHEALEDADRIRGLQAVPLMKASAAWNIFRKSGSVDYLKLAAGQIQEAEENNPYDKQLVSFDAVIRYYMGDNEQAEAVLKELVSRYPDNVSYNLLLANLLYLDGRKTQSVEYFSNAVLSAPSILESDVWGRFSEDDSEIRESVLNNVKNNVVDRPSDPIALSKYGKLSYLVGDNAAAKKYLEAAAEALPNLETPWVYLARIAKEENDMQTYSLLMNRLSLWGYKEGNLLTGQRDYTSDYNLNMLAPDYSGYCLKLEIWHKVFLDDDIINFNID